MRFKRRTEEDSRINITPLIDVVFLLLIFFMLTSHFDVASGVRIRLPKISQKAYERDDQKITVVVDQEGRPYLEGQRLDDNDFVVRIRALVEKDGFAHLVLHADQDVKHGRVVQIMDMAKTAGISTILIAAQWDTQKVF
jgi:biopolymer transport protein ExbD